MDPEFEPRGALRVHGVPARDPALAARLAAYQNVRHAAYCGRHASGEGCLILTRFANTAQVHHVRTPGGARRQLTFLNEPVKACIPVPEHLCRSGATPPGFVYGIDTGGDEQLQYWFANEATGVHTLLTNGTAMHRDATWHDSEPMLIYASNERDGTHFDLYTSVITGAALDAAAAAAAGGATPPTEVWRRRCVYTSGDETGYVSPLHYAGGYVLARHYRSVTEARLFIVDAHSGGIAAVIAPIGAGTAAVPDGVMALDPATRRPVGVLFASDEDQLFRTLRFAALPAAATTSTPTSTPIRCDSRILHPGVPWGVSSVHLCNDSGVFIAVYNEDGVSTLYTGALTPARDDVVSPVLRKLAIARGGEGHANTAGAAVPLIGVLSGSAHLGPGARAEGGDKKTVPRTVFGFSIITGDAPTDVYTVEVPEAAAAASGEIIAPAVRWTESEVGGLAAETFSAAELIHFTSFDGLVVPAFVYAPKGKAGAGAAAKPSKTPVVIHPHGGPEGQHRPKFMPFYQYLTCELGVCVIDPNVRGSSGYGKEYVSMDDGKKREDSVKDLGALIEWIEESEDARVKYNLDPARIAVWGGSYGGYMTLAALTHYPEKLRCGVNMVGISNFVTFLENTKGYRRDLRRLKYGDERDPGMRQFLMDISPCTNAHRITSPLFIVQGANDPRVPRSEAEQIFRTVAGRGGAVWYMLADDEGHGFRKKQNVDAYQEAMVAFLSAHLL